MKKLKCALGIVYSFKIIYILFIKIVHNIISIFRFGHVCLTDFPKEPLWPIEKLNDKILSDSRLQSKFATWQVN